jgi:outer membrane protein
MPCQCQYCPRQCYSGGDLAFRSLFFLLLLLAPAFAWAAENPASQPEVMTLEQAVALALENNRTVKNAELEVSKQEDGLAVARTRRLPAFDITLFGSIPLQRIDFTFKQGDFGTFPGGGPNPSTDVRISTPRTLNLFALASVNQPLSQLYRINLGIRATEVSRELAKEDLRAQRQSVVNDVKKAYFTVLQTQSALEATEESIKLYRELDRVTGEYVLQQVALKSQGLEVTTRLAKAEYDSLTLRNALSSQKEHLNQLLGRSITTEFQVNPIPEITPYETDLAVAHARALEQRPEVRESRLKLKQAELDRRSKKSEFIPDVSLSYRYISPFSIEVLPKNISFAGLYFSWEPFDWGRKRRELAEKKKTEEQANNGVEDAEALVLLDVNSRFRKLQEERASLRISQLSQQTEREKLRVVSNRYSEKAALLNDVLESESALAQANHQYRQSLANFWTAKAEFEKALGEER